MPENLAQDLVNIRSGIVPGANQQQSVTWANIYFNLIYYMA